MQIENDDDKEVYNGDIGYIDDVKPDDGELTASFDGRAVTYGCGELDPLAGDATCSAELRLTHGYFVLCQSLCARL